MEVNVAKRLKEVRKGEKDNWRVVVTELLQVSLETLISAALTIYKI
jgi:hypothetical protein